MVYFDLYDLLITAHPPKRTVMTMLKPDSIDAYIAGFPETVQEKLRQMRDTIRKAAPDAEESISYGIAAYTLHKRPLVYFAGAKKHVGLYATPTGHEKFKDEFSVYKTGKGSVQFPLEKPLPLELITKVVQFRAQENKEREQVKKFNKQSQLRVDE